MEKQERLDSLNFYIPQVNANVIAKILANRPYVCSSIVELRNALLKVNGIGKMKASLIIEFSNEHVKNKRMNLINGLNKPSNLIDYNEQNSCAQFLSKYFSKKSINCSDLPVVSNYKNTAITRVGSIHNEASSAACIVNKPSSDIVPPRQIILNSSMLFYGFQVFKAVLRLFLCLFSF